MADNDETQRARRRDQREQQYEIDRITAQYVIEFRLDRSPHIEDYVRQYPQYTQELLEFAVYFHTVGLDAAEPDQIPAAEEARAIAVATIPPTLVRRLADTLNVTPEAVASYLGAARPGDAGAFYYADQPPTQQQEPFLDAVQASALSPERKREWAEIVSEDAGRTGE